jgi:hypothetical protein
MGAVLALAPLASLLVAATLEPAFSLRTEGRGTRYVPRDAKATSRAAVSAVPQATLTVDGPPLRLQAGYAATLWTSDVAQQRDPWVLVNHAVDARLELLPDAPWRAVATAGAVRGKTDPLASAPTSGPAEPASQLASTGAVPYQALRADLRAERQLDLRTTVTAAGRWSDAQVLRSELDPARTEAAVALMPPQRGAGASLGLSRRITERDTLSAGSAGDWSETRTAAGLTTGVSATADASWRRALTPLVDGWGRLGAGFLYTDEPAPPVRRDVLPMAGAGLARRAAAGGVGGEASVSLTSAVDRFRGDVRQVVDARLDLSWAPAERITVSGQASGARRVDGDTTLGAATVRVAWAVRPGVALHAGALWRLQREHRPELPSFTEAGVFMGLQVTASRR